VAGTIPAAGRVVLVGVSGSSGGIVPGSPRSTQIPAVNATASRSKVTRGRLMGRRRAGKGAFGSVVRRH
jgi:hypothetical protein